MKLKKIIATVLIGTTMMTTLSGCNILANTRHSVDKTEATNDSRTLYNGQYYVWHNPDNDDIKKDLNKANEHIKKPIFRPVYQGITSFSTAEYMHTGSPQRVVLTNSFSEKKIPTLFSGDKLIYYTEEELPKEFILERYYDLGYSVGLYGIRQYGETNIYAMIAQDEIKGYLPTDAGAVEIANELITNEKNVYIAAIGKQPMTAERLSPAGTILGLNKDELYNVTYSLGTEQKNAACEASAHIWYNFESFYIDEVEFLTNDIITLTLPDYLKTGYYYINGIGMFRYVAEGNKWSNNTKFNEPIILQDENGNVVEDPSAKNELYEEPTENLQDASDTDKTNDMTADAAEEVTVKDGDTLTVVATFDEPANPTDILKAPYVLITITDKDENTHTIKKALESGVTLQLSCSQEEKEDVSEDGPSSGDLFEGKYTVMFFNLSNYENVTTTAVAVPNGAAADSATEAADSATENED